MAPTLPEGNLETRLSRYLDGFNNRHGIEDSLVEGDLVQVVVKPDDLPAVLTTAPMCSVGRRPRSTPMSRLPVK